MRDSSLIPFMWQFVAAVTFGLWMGSFAAGLWMFVIVSLAIYLW